MTLADRASRRQDVAELYQDVRNVELALAAEWITELPPDFRYHSVPFVQHDGLNYVEPVAVYPLSLDRYHDAYVANNWNQWRTYRIHLLIIVIKCVIHLRQCESKHATPTEDNEAKVKICRLVDDICSSVPYYVEAFLGASSFPHAPARVCWQNRTNFEKSSNAFLLIPHLRFASEVECVPEAQRQWMRGYLLAILEPPRPALTRA